MNKEQDEGKTKKRKMEKKTKRPWKKKEKMKNR